MASSSEDLSTFVEELMIYINREIQQLANLVHVGEPGDFIVGSEARPKERSGFKVIQGRRHGDLGLLDREWPPELHAWLDLDMVALESRDRVAFQFGSQEILATSVVPPSCNTRVIILCIPAGGVRAIS